MSANTANTNYSSLLYHFTNESNGVPVYPYITAVTGHRSFAQPSQAEDIPGFTEQDIKNAFKAQLEPMAKLWKDSCNGTAPFIIMTGMADGADQIAAEAALELDPNLNIKIVAILPMEKEIYIKTIENQERFNRLMQLTSFNFTLPLTPNNIGFESELGRICDETEFRRQEQYANLGHFLAAHSHVLFAFWDGIPSTRLKGGTADTVFYKLIGNIERQNQSDLLTFSSVGPVVHLLIPRDNQDNRNYPLASDLDMSSIPVFFLTRNILREKVKFDLSSSPDNPNFKRKNLISEIRCRSNVAKIEDLKSILERIGNMNRDSISCFKNQSFVEKCKDSYQELLNSSKLMDKNVENELFQNRFDHLDDYEDSDTRLLAEHYAVADQIALKYQKRSHNILILYLICFGLCIFFYSLLTTLWTIRIMDWAKDPDTKFNQVWNKSSIWDNFPCLKFQNDFSINTAGEKCPLCKKSQKNKESTFKWSRFEFICLPKSTALYLLTVAALVIIYFIALAQKYHYRYHRFRALAEALRIQIYWRIAGMSDCVSAYYRSHQIQETEWIRAAINSIDVFLDKPSDSGFKAKPEERLNFSIEKWVKGQRDYYTNKKNVKKDEQNGFDSLFTHQVILYILALSYFCIPLKGDIFNLSIAFFSKHFNICFPQPCPITLWVFCGFSALVTVLTIFYVVCNMRLKFKRSKAEAKRFEQILFPFDRATLLLNTEKEPDQQKMILRQLGTEAISENVNWLLTVGEQDLTLPR